MYCFGWQSGGVTSQDGSDVILLGGNHFQLLLLWDDFLVSDSTYADLVLSNKLVVYDLDNEVIGWAEHNCKYLKP